MQVKNETYGFTNLTFAPWEYSLALDAIFGSNRSQIEPFYPASGPNTNATVALYTLLTDYLFICPCRLAAASISKVRACGSQLCRTHLACSVCRSTRTCICKHPSHPTSLLTAAPLLELIACVLCVRVRNFFRRYNWMHSPVNDLTDQKPGCSGQQSACHSCDIPYVFNTQAALGKPFTKPVR